MLSVRGRVWCRPVQWRPDRGTCCVEIDTPPDRPDLAIYSQEEQFALGVKPTWNNPDITVPPKLNVRDLKVTIRNLSPSASAVNGVVEFSTSDFGIGVPRILESIQRISLPPNGQIVLPFSTRSVIIGPPKAPDPHVGVHIRLVHPYDARQINNSGSSMVAEGFTSYIGRAISILFHTINQAATPRVITLGLLQNDLGATVTPAAQLFAPLEQVWATLTLDVADTLHGTPGAPLHREATVVGRTPDGSVIDGLTCVVWIDD
jgi:hypothetical protein